jgi:hypothetical protein
VPGSVARDQYELGDRAARIGGASGIVSVGGFDVVAGVVVVVVVAAAAVGERRRAIVVARQTAGVERIAGWGRLLLLREMAPGVAPGWWVERWRCRVSAVTRIAEEGIVAERVVGCLAVGKDQN